MSDTSKTRSYVPLLDAMAAISAAEERLLALLKQAYPIGTEVLVYLRSEQINPTRGTVQYHHGGRYGVIVVKLDTPRQHVVHVAVDRVRFA